MPKYINPREQVEVKFRLRKDVRDELYDHCRVEGISFQTLIKGMIVRYCNENGLNETQGII